MTNPTPFADPELPTLLQRSWRRFLDVVEPLRPDLYRYCRHLTRSPFDAEDLVQDTLARAYVTVGQMHGQGPEHPKAWLFRIASNLWLDRARHQRLTDALPAGPDATGAPDPVATREAAGTLLSQLAPQERAAVVLKEVCELSLEEIAEALSTSVGAVKAALHRGRGKLAEPKADAPALPKPAALDAFCAAFNAHDVGRLTSLLLDTSAVEVLGATTLYGPEKASKTVIPGMLFGSQRMAVADPITGMDPSLVQGVLPKPPRAEARPYRDSWLVLLWYAHQDGEFVRGFVTLEADGDRVGRLVNVFYNPELISDVCAELQVPFRLNGRSWCVPKA
jgi:RNA polymerase sigma-70 factor (ECF subfamily)